eukprot:179697_1
MIQIHCQDNIFDSSTHVCCASGVGSGDDCCYGSAYDTVTHDCCEPAQNIFELSTHVCCHNGIGTGDACCGGSAYDTATHDCCESAQNIFELSTHVCCHNGIGTGDACCDGNAYDKSIHGCCGTSNVYDLETDICCAEQVYDYSHFERGFRVCCESGVSTCCDADKKDIGESCRNDFDCCGNDNIDTSKSSGHRLVNLVHSTYDLKCSVQEKSGDKLKKCCVKNKGYGCIIDDDCCQSNICENGRCMKTSSSKDSA